MFFIAGLVRSPALYGLLSVPVCVFGLDVEFKTIRGAATHSGGFLEWFYASILLSLVAYPVLLVIHALMLAIAHRFRHSDRPVILGVADAIGADLTNPFRGLAALKVGQRAIDSTGLASLWPWFVQVVHFVWALALWGYFAFGFAAVLTT